MENKEEILQPHERPFGNQRTYTDKERRLIEKLIKDGLSQRGIAEKLRRTHGSINSEVKRFSNGSWKTYSAEMAISTAKENFKKRGWSKYRLLHGLDSEEKIYEKVKGLAEKGYSKNRICTETGLGYTCVARVFAKLQLKETGVYGNEKRISSLEEKIDYISNSIDIILDVLKQTKEAKND